MSFGSSFGSSMGTGSNMYGNFFGAQGGYSGTSGLNNAFGTTSTAASGLGNFGTTSLGSYTQGSASLTNPFSTAATYTNAANSWQGGTTAAPSGASNWSASWRPSDSFTATPNHQEPEWLKTARTVRDYLAESAPQLVADPSFVLKFDQKEEKILITFTVKARGTCNEWWGKVMETARKAGKAEYTDLVCQYWTSFRLQLELRSTGLSTTGGTSADKKEASSPAIQVTVDVDGFNDAKKTLTASISTPNSRAADASNLAAGLYTILKQNQEAEDEENDEAVRTRQAIAALQELGVSVYDYRHSSGKGKPADLAGYEEVKQQVFQSIALPLRHKAQLLSLLKQTRGASAAYGALVRGVLFVGPPGVGKTSLAKLVASRIGSILIYVPVESIMSKWYGVAEQRLAEVFRQTARLSEAIMFLDELDGFVPRRDANIHEATRRMLSVLLRHLDGLDTRGNIITIGATNRPSDLDSALVSRFDEKIVFNCPNEVERASIFSMYAKTLKEPECAVLGQNSEGLTGRDIRACCTAAERYWAFDFLMRQKDAQTIPPPPASVYLDVLKKRLSSLLEFQEVGQ